MSVLYTVLRVMRSSSVALSGLVIGRLHYCVGLVGDFPLLRATSDYFSAASSPACTSPSGVQGKNITEAVPESAEETAEEADLSTLVDISILSCKVPYAFTNFWGEP